VTKKQQSEPWLETKAKTNKMIVVNIFLRRTLSQQLTTSCFKRWYTWIQIQKWM